MALKKPPLVEVWMSFQFSPALNSPSWNRDRYKLFLERIPEYSNVEEMIRTGIQVERSQKTKTSRVKAKIIDEVIAIRALTEDNLRAIQMTPDGLVVNYLQSETHPYPGFLVLLDEAMNYCKHYMDCYQPIGVLNAALHYVDLVEIPIPADGILKTEDYLTLNIQMPEAIFGYVAGFDFKALVRPPGSTSYVEIGFSSDPVHPEENSRRFRIEWHTAVQTDSTMTKDIVRVRLETDLF